MLRPIERLQWCARALRERAFTALKPEDLPHGFSRLRSGKVRELFADGRGHLLMVASDRISAYDRVLPTQVPGKGVVLTQMSLGWASLLRGRIAGLEDGLVPAHDEALEALWPSRPDLRSRSMLAHERVPLPVEVVVRGWLSGSGWKEYQRTGSLWGRAVPAGLREADALPEPLFTPTTKDDAGDQPLSPQQARDILGEAEHARIEAIALALYRCGAERARRAGFILADTKFELGRDAGGQLYLIDEILTPDSSRYWREEDWRPGRTPPGYDKQPVRDYLRQVGFEGKGSPPELPAAIVEHTQSRYFDVMRRLMGSGD